MNSTTTKTTAHQLSVVRCAYGDGTVVDPVIEVPDRAEVYDDGRVRATFGDRTQWYANPADFDVAMGLYVHVRRVDAPGVLAEVPSLNESYTLQVDWAEVHHLMSEIERARAGSDIGYRHPQDSGDAFGGTYHFTFADDLSGLVRLLRGVDSCAQDAWHDVHGAHRTADVERARRACQVAIACSRAYDLFHRCGLIRDPASRICGTGPGYGLTGLRWLAGQQHDSGVSSAAVEAFARGADIHTALEAD